MEPGKALGTPKRPGGPPPSETPQEVLPPGGSPQSLTPISPGMKFLSSMKSNMARRKSERQIRNTSSSESNVVQNERSVTLGAEAEEEHGEEEHTPFSKVRMRNLMRRSLALSEVKRKGLIEDREKRLDELEGHVREHEMKHIIDVKERMLREKEEEVEALKQRNQRIEEEQSLLKSKADSHERQMAQDEEAMRRAQAIEELHSKRREKAATSTRMNSPLTPSMKGKKRRETLFRENADLYHSGEGPPASGNRLPAPPARTAPAPTSRDYVGEGHMEVKDAGLYDPSSGVSMPDLPPPPPPPSPATAPATPPATSPATCICNVCDLDGPC